MLALEDIGRAVGSEKAMPANSPTGEGSGMWPRGWFHKRTAHAVPRGTLQDTYW